MKKSIKTVALILIGFVVTTAFIISGSNSLPGADEKPAGKPWPCPEKNAKMVSPIKPDEGILAAGKDVWLQHCKSCHGKTGKGDGTKAENIDISCGDFTSEKYVNITDGELYWKTTEGRKPMPSFKLKLSDIERWSVVLYSRTFAEKAKTAKDKETVNLP
ncbi:MAG TPA: cytochrome c [Bacteroidia bacterium]|nr:cytochrome c [Bacteroidia bacterium]